MNQQTELDFTITSGYPHVHQHENNSASQHHLEKNKNHFKAQNKKVLDLLMSGKRLTVLGAANDYQVMSLPRRIGDLREINKITIQDRFIPGTRIKEYWI